ncbi:hypothetical protein [uncultured Thomasclavelia sp.]|uniref:hypothetical protein n=1 Tax=uncultured Thomasclavelia sp. TaxID=3025759 RepID=UPI00280A602D|nr:hypothetical protein [uncultured Thomasclavelia sp.]
MDFQSGKHLTNYLLKILRNNDITVPEEDAKDIKLLGNVYTFLSNLPTDIKKNLIFAQDYQPWIFLAQSNHYKHLAEISKASNENIDKFISDYNSISFNVVFKSFELNISYDPGYLHTKPNDIDIYYPHQFKIIEGINKLKQWSIAYFNKPKISRNDTMGCYFVYDNNGEIVYIGKSNCHLFDRACTSAQNRTNGNFSKIELYPMSTHSDTNIYEMYFIALHYPKYNLDSCYPDKPTFKLPKIKPKYIIERVGTKNFDIEQIDPVFKYISSDEYWKSPKSYYLFDDNHTLENFNLFFT